VNDSVAEIQTRDDALRGIELNHATHVDGERGQAFELEIERKRAQTGGRNAGGGDEIEFAAAKTDDAGADFSEYAPPFKTLPNLHAKKSFGYLAVVASGAKLALARKEIAGASNSKPKADSSRELYPVKGTSGIGNINQDWDA